MKHKIRRYSEAFRRQVVCEYEAGESVSALQKKYAINGATTIPGWIRKYGTQGFRHEVVRIQTADEAQRVQELEQQVNELQQALGKVTLEKLKLESVLETLQEDAREVKKNARPSSSGCGTKSNSKANCE